MPERAHARIVGRLLPALAIGVLSLAVLVATPARAFSNAALIEGFVDTVFGAEVGGDTVADTSTLVKKFTHPVRYHLVSSSTVDRRSSVRRFMGQLSDAVQNLSLTETLYESDADVVIFLMDRADYASTIRATVWKGVNTRFLEENACSAVIAARRTGIERAFIYLVADEGFVSFSHCMVEEVAQSLGPANDSSLLPDSIFNDNSTLNVFGVFDWFILNMLYDARIRPGMGEADVRPLLPAIIADVRRRLPQALGQESGALVHR
ncbi:MAG: DUF2927 domain-containing protein [Pseudomonadota bacterium]